MIRLLLIAVALAAAFPVIGCGFENGYRAIYDDSEVLHYQFRQTPPKVSQHFSVQFQYCRNGKAVALDRFRLDAIMPAHGHGMNYGTKATKLENEVVEASGLLFHMPGQWQLVLDFEEGGVARQFKLDYRI